MTVERNQIGWAIWLVWVLMTTMGWALGFLIGFVLGSIIGDVLGDWSFPLFFGIGLGICIGVLQWLLLRGYVSRAGWWVLTSAAGGYGIALAGFEVLNSLGALLSLIGVVALGGAVTGILQWLVLRGQVSRAGWWVLASTVGWGLSMAVAGVLEEPFSMSLFGGAVLGAVTGGALVWLLRQPVPEA